MRTQPGGFISPGTPSRKDVMQRLAGDFLVRRTVKVYGQGGAVTELYELPNGQWQFGKGRDAVVVRSLDQVSALDESTKKDVEAWLERTKHRPAPEPIQQGQTPLLAGETVKDRLSQAINNMPNEIAARLLLAVEQTLGPVADSLKQSAPINHHSDGYGQDMGMPAPASVDAGGFSLPAGARWANPNNPASGYLMPDMEVRDEKGNPTTRWHPTPDFHAVTEQPEPVPIADTAPLKVHVPDDIEKEIAQERRSRGTSDLVGAGRRSRRR